MFVDTSALVAILAPERDAKIYVKALDNDVAKYTSAVVVLEATMVLTRFRNDSPHTSGRLVDEFIETAGLEILAIDGRTSQIAKRAFERFGKGRGHPAQLNLADCLSYAIARQHDLPILFKGNDFSRTDLRSALK